MAKLTLQQKRLEALKRQLYGKEPQTQKKSPEKNKIVQEKQTTQQVYLLDRFKKTSSEISKQAEPQTEVSYLRRDLLKIFMLSAIAITIQVILFIGFKNNLVNLGW